MESWRFNLGHLCSWWITILELSYQFPIDFNTASRYFKPNKQQLRNELNWKVYPQSLKKIFLNHLPLIYPCREGILKKFRENFSSGRTGILLIEVKFAGWLRPDRFHSRNCWFSYQPHRKWIMHGLLVQQFFSIFGKWCL